MGVRKSSHPELWVYCTVHIVLLSIPYAKFCLHTSHDAPGVWVAGSRLMNGRTRTRVTLTRITWRTSSPSWTACGLPSAHSCNRAATSCPSKCPYLSAGSAHMSGTTHTPAMMSQMCWRTSSACWIHSGLLLGPSCSRAVTSPRSEQK